MEEIKKSIDLLVAVRSTMDTISVVGIENQDKFVGCANAIQTVVNTLDVFMQTQDTAREEGPAEEVPKEELNGR